MWRDGEIPWHEFSWLLRHMSAVAAVGELRQARSLGHAMGLLGESGAASWADYQGALEVEVFGSAMAGLDAVSEKYARMREEAERDG